MESYKSTEIVSRYCDYMRGRTPYNKPEIRRKELLYYLFDKEKVRWKTIRDDFRKRKWGPTTLKRHLDVLCKEDLVSVHVTHGSKGPEVWYLINFGKVAEKLYKLQKRLVETKVERFSLDELKDVSPRLRVLVFKQMINLLMAQFINYSFITALSKFKNAELKNLDRIVKLESEYFWDVGFKNGFMQLVNFILAYPVEVQIAVAEMLGRDELKAWVEGRELEVLSEMREIIREANAILLSLIPELLNSLRKMYENAKSKDEILVFRKAIHAFEDMLTRLKEKKSLQMTKSLNKTVRI